MRQDADLLSITSKLSSTSNYRLFGGAARTQEQDLCVTQNLFTPTLMAFHRS